MTGTISQKESAEMREAIKTVRCSHGRTMDEPCPECRARHHISIAEMLERMATDQRRKADAIHPDQTSGETT